MRLILLSTFSALLISTMIISGSNVLAQEKGKPDYLNSDIPIEKRVDDLVSKMTLEEKASQMVNGAPEISRLNIPEYNWWNESLHGVARAGYATVFPQAIALSATWDTPLMFKVAAAISTEARAKNNDFISKNQREIYKGLTFWSPNINIFRDPRWGRGQETYGEDPYLTGRMGVAFVKGLQGDDPKYFKVIATPKHYAVHSGPEPERHRFNAVISDHDLYDTYLPAFQACVQEGKAYSVMCAYNRFMGDACCGSNVLEHRILREEWGFPGYIVSDCGAIDDIFRNHKIVETGPEAAAIAVKAGTDLECGSVYPSAIVDAVKQGLLTEQQVDVSLRRLFTARFKLGMFDPPEMVKYTKIPISENDSEEHRQLSLQTARESIVLLKNSNNVLPLNKDIKKIAVIGPNADSYAMLIGNYNGTPSKYVTPFQGIKNKLTNAEVIYEPGCNLVEKGSIINYLSPDIVYTDNVKGLKLEAFNNKNFEGEPFFSKTDVVDNSNLVWGARIPNLRLFSEFSIRWTGKLKMPDTGDYNFIISGDDGYRLYIDDKVVVEDWNVHQQVTKNSNHIHLEKGKSYNFKLEFFQSAGRPQLFVQWQKVNVDPYKEALQAAKNSDVIVFVGGITAQLEGEEMWVNLEGFQGGDRTSLDIPEVQQDLLKLLSETGKPVILVLTSGSALSVNWENENIPAIVQLWYPGEEGGNALADVLFGDYNPAGRLPVTFYKSVDQLPSFEDYSMKGRTYRYFDGEPLYPFGYGLSYSSFKYSSLKIPSETEAGDEVSVNVEVQNTGKIAGDEVVQLYVKHIQSSLTAPISSLQGFKRVHLNPGEKQTISFKLSPKQLALVNDEHKWIEEPGRIQITVGGILPGAKASTTENISKEFIVTGQQQVIE